MPEPRPRNYNILKARIEGTFLMTGLGAIVGAIAGELLFDDWMEGLVLGGFGGFSVVSYVFWLSR